MQLNITFPNEGLQLMIKEFMRERPSDNNNDIYAQDRERHLVDSKRNAYEE